jgi:pimeloyl-ACP methyl ester carboxylesterase
MLIMRLLLIVAATLAICYLALLGTIYLWQSRLVFFPVRQLRSNPSQYRLEFEDVMFQAGKETLHAWYLEGRPGQPVVLYCHGNAGNIADRLPQIRAIHDEGLSVLAFDYAGYGWSTGEPSESQMYVDAAAAFSWLVQRGFPSQRIIVYGESLGGAVAAQLASAVRPLLLVLEATFTSLADVARMHYSWVPVGLLLKYRFDTREHLARVQCRTVVLHSPQDEVVPFEQARQLCAGLSLCRFIEVRGTHNTMPPLPWSRILTENGIKH